VSTLGITSGNILVTGASSGNSVSINALNSATVPAELLFINTGGTGDFRIRGDGGDVAWQGGGGRALQMGAYHGINLIGGRNTATNITYEAGENALYNTKVVNSNNSIGLIVQGGPGQTSDLQNWTDSAGLVLASVDSNGDVFSNGFLLFGRDYNYSESIGTSSTSSTTPLIKTSFTTGNISGGTYAIHSCWASSTSTNNATWLVSIVVDGSIVRSSRSSNSNQATDIQSESLLDIVVLSGGVHIVHLQFSRVENQTYTIRDSRIWLYRVA
jgi:hypothetical protein